MCFNVDMTHRFAWRSEPIGEQLLAIMLEVGEETCRKSDKIAQQVLEHIEREVFVLI